MNTLVLVDIQNDFMPGGSLAVEKGDEVVKVANALMTIADVVIATQDWHPASHGSFASAHPGRTPGDVVNLGGITQVLWPDHCVQNSPGASFHSGLDVAGIDAVIRKGTDPGIDSYSGFFDNEHLKDTGLESLLAERGAERIWIMGLATDYCVKYTALDGVAAGFDVMVVIDGVRAVELTPGDGAQAIADMRDAGCTTVHSFELLG